MTILSSASLKQIAFGLQTITRQPTTKPMTDGRIYVGNLPPDVQERDIEDLFFKYGKIRDIELKNNRGTIPFAFVRFEDPRDAEDAVYGRNGYGFGDCKLRVEYPRSSSSKFSSPMGGGPRGRFGPPTRRSEFRVIVTGLPPTGSWQDLKDHMREAGDVCFADVQRDGEGVVEFLRREDMEGRRRTSGSTRREDPVGGAHGPGLGPVDATHPPTKAGPPRHPAICHPPPAVTPFPATAPLLITVPHATTDRPSSPNPPSPKSLPSHALESGSVEYTLRDTGLVVWRLPPGLERRRKGESVRCKECQKDCGRFSVWSADAQAGMFRTMGMSLYQKCRAYGVSRLLEVFLFG
ncbi:hypothetical protein JZ751_005745 [Albula glossodonta]|uniref:RRM domain-containing protein n=1 Tax=Albula glossodonta TaxID=121402 RepID=A0A8T2N6Q3_9TELE|nr:hypothetical protein JZ751_005745 [Albula glossodonta]